MLLRTFARRSTSWSVPSLLVALSIGLAGCALDGTATDTSHVGASARALEASDLADAALEVDGAFVGRAARITVDEAGSVAVTFDAGASPDLLSRVLRELSGNGGDASNLRAQATTDKGVREIELSTCLMKEVSFSQLKADEGKGVFMVTVTWMPTEVKYSNGSGTVIAGKVPSSVVRWSVDVPGLAEADIAGASMTARRPTKSYAAWTVDGLKVSGSAAYGGGVKDAQELVDAGAPVDVTLVIAGDATGTTTKVVVPAKPVKVTKGGDDKAPQWTLDLLCESQTIAIVQR